MIVQTVLEHWVRIWTRPAPQIIDINEHFARTTAPEMGRLLMFDSVGNLVVLLDLKKIIIVTQISFYLHKSA